MKKIMIQILRYTITVKYHNLNTFFASIFLQIIIILNFFYSFLFKRKFKMSVACNFTK